MEENLDQNKKATEAKPEKKEKAPLTKAEAATKLIRYHAFGSIGVGLIPVPWLDMIGLIGVQLNLLRAMAKIYGVPFLKEKGKNIIAALIGSAAPVSISPNLASMFKAIPILGTPLSLATMPALAGGTTYAIGQVFLQHFESGGTFLNFKPDKVKEHFDKKFKEAKAQAAA